MRQNYEIKVATPIMSKKMMEKQKGQKRSEICRWPWQTLHRFFQPCWRELSVPPHDGAKVGTAGAWLSGSLLLQWSCSWRGLGTQKQFFKPRSTSRA